MLVYPLSKEVSLAAGNRFAIKNTQKRSQADKLLN